MKTISWILNTGYIGCSHEGTFEIDENATEAEIEEAVKEEVFNEISWGWEEVKTKSDR